MAFYATPQEKIDHNNYFYYVRQYLLRNNTVTEQMDKLIATRQFYGLVGFKLSTPYRILQDYKKSIWAASELQLYKYINLKIQAEVYLKNNNQAKLRKTQTKLFELDTKFFALTNMTITDYLHYYGTIV